MKVGMVCPYDWSHPGGVRTHIVGLSNALRRKGVEVEIMAPASSGEPGIFALGRTLGIPYNGSVARLNFSFAARTRIAKRLAGGDLDLLHIHEPFAPSVSFLALMQTTLPAVATFHAHRDRSLAYALARPLLERFGGKVDHRIVVSEAARSLISRYLPSPRAAETLLPNGVEVAMYRDADEDPEMAALKPFVLFVGRAEPRKGLRPLVRAMELVRRSWDGRLVIAGSNRKEAEEQAGGALPGWAEAIGPVGQERLPGLYRSAEVFCAPSVGGESFGYILAEAMAAGTPVVASSLPGYIQASGGAALFAPPGDVDGLSAKLLTVLTNGELAQELSDKGRARALELDWDVLVDVVVGIYRRALGRSIMGAS